MAVLPFSPAGADTTLARLGRDLAGTVSASLDGVGEIRMVDRLTILAQTQDRKSALPLADAAALGRRYGATSVVAGSLARDGGKVRLDVGLYSTDSLRPLARAIVTGSPDSLSALTDSVTWRVLAEVWRRGKPPTPTLEAVTTHSVEALRAYLDGEEASVAGRIREARAAYDRAVAIDSTFWYAYFRAASAAGWYEGDIDPAATQAFFRHRDLLPRRERLLIEATVLDSGLVWRRARLRSLVEDYPDYWPAWFILGDLLVHVFPYIGSSRAEARHALERVVALNPRMVYAWGHLVWMYQADRDTAATARALDALDRLGARARFIENEGVDRMLLWRTIQALQAGSSDSVRLLDSLYQFAIDTSTSDAFALAAELGAASPATQIRFTQRVLRHGVSPARADGFRTFVPMMWAARGAWDSALALLDETADTDSLYPRGLQSYGLAVLGTWLGAIPPGEARTRRPAAAKAAAAASTRLARYLNKELAWLDGIEAMSRGDTAALVSAAAAVHAAGDTLGDSLRDRIVDLSPYVLALRGDRSTAGRRLAEVEWKAADRNPNMGPGVYPLLRVISRTAAADWLLQSGDTAQATQLLLYREAFMGPFWEKLAVLPLLAFRQAQIEEARGQWALARRDYTSFLICYDMPPPPHLRLVEEARAALGRLGRAGEAPVGQ
jgi:TolB-like protein